MKNFLILEVSKSVFSQVFRMSITCRQNLQNTTGYRIRKANLTSALGTIRIHLVRAIKLGNKIDI